MTADTTPAVTLRPGAGGRILQNPLTRIIVGGGALVAVRVLPSEAAHTAGIRAHTPAALVEALLLVAAVLATYYACVRALERRPVTELGRTGAFAETLYGGLLGTLLFSVVILLLVLLGIAQVGRGASAAMLVYPFAAAVLAGVWEETLFRGVLFRIIEERFGSWIALAFSAAFFGGVHGLNAGATLVSDLAIALEAGVLLGAAYMYSRRLWLPIGLHIGWNFTEGGIFGTSVSGGQAHGLLATVLQGPDLLTGGKFGPEASLVAVIVCFALGALFCAFAARRGRLLPIPRHAWSAARRPDNGSRG
jgi:uncharacterized protein